MAQTITVNGVNRSGVIPRKKVTWAESAYLCEIGTGKVVVDDVAGTLVIPGFKTLSVEQSSSTPSRIATGFVGVKKIRYGKDSGIRPPGREIEFATLDLNDLVRRLVLRGKSANRKTSESIGDRLTWLLATDFVAPFVADFGAVTYPDEGLDKDDLRGKYPGDVLVQWAKVVRFNAYVRYKAGETLAELVFRDDNASTDDTCTLSISNYPGDANASTVFAPLEGAEPELTQDPEDVYSGAYGAHAKGHVYEIRTATAAEFTARDGITEDSGADNDATAARDARTFLHESKDEEQMLPVTVELSAAKVGLIQAGMRIPTRMQHMTPEGWNPARYARILRVKRTQPLDTDDVYHVAMDLSPQEAGPSIGAIVQSAFRNVGAGGGTLSLPNPVTPGNLLVYAVADRVDPNPVQPNITTDQPNWGTDAWTRFNGATITDVGTGSPKHGCAMYYKIADSANRTGFTHATDANIGIWELSGVTVTGATVAFADETTGTPYDLGTLGTAAVGTVAIMVVEWDVWGPLETVDAAAGWTERWFDGAFPHWLGPHAPHAWFGDALGAGAALDPMISTGVSKEYAGVAVLLPAI